MTTAAHKPVIGLLGGPGSGKSFVAQAFAAQGCGVIDADRIAREALDDPEVRSQLVAWWGGDIVTPDGRVDRKAVARIVFDQPAELQRLESAVHPRVAARRAELRRAFNADPKIRAIIEDVPLLLEKNLDAGCDVLVFVDAPRTVRLERVARTRGWTEADLDAREKNQLPLDSKRRAADYVLDNSAGESQLSEQVRTVLAQLFPERA